MLANLVPGYNCVVCNIGITDEHKELLKKTKLAQTWCLNCLAKWVNDHPHTVHKHTVAVEFRKLGTEISTDKR